MHADQEDHHSYSRGDLGLLFMMTFGKEPSSRFLQLWLKGKNDIVLVTGRASYTACGAETFLTPFLSGRSVTHLRTVGENARAEDVDVKRALLPRHMDAYIAIGGGTVIDTSKLLRGLDGELPPFLAVPTTAGTGAETTRFAVYYDHGKKMSADDVRYLPTDQLLIPEFTATQTPYQRASTEFDAYDLSDNCRPCAFILHDGNVWYSAWTRRLYDVPVCLQGERTRGVCQGSPGTSIAAWFRYGEGT